MTFYYVEADNTLEGNYIGIFTEVDGESVAIDVDDIMEEGRGLAKLREMKRAIDDAIEANGGEL